MEHYLTTNITEGWIAGPFPIGAIASLQTNRMGVIPKPRVPEKWRLITDLSFPAGASIYNEIDPAVHLFHYTSGRPNSTRAWAGVHSMLSPVFTAVADTLERCMHQYGISGLIITSLSTQPLGPLVAAYARTTWRNVSLLGSLSQPRIWRS